MSESEQNNRCYAVSKGLLVLGALAGSVWLNYILWQGGSKTVAAPQASPVQAQEPRTNPGSLEGICDLNLNLTSSFTEPSKERLEQYKEVFGFGQKFAVKHHGGMPATSPYEFSVKELDGLEGNVLNIFGRSYKIGDAKLLMTKEDVEKEGQILFHRERQILFMTMTRDDGQLACLRADVSDKEEDYLSGLVEGVFKDHSIHMEGKTYGQTFALTRIRIAKP